MTVRLLSVTTALLTGLLALFLVGLAHNVATVSADDPEKKNCPAGFVWIRWSPNGCSQETLPGNGKIGYDGHAICEEGYQGIYERRETTDGKPAPGSPYTSFPYLLQCVTPQEYAALEAAGELPDQSSGGGDSSAVAGGGEFSGTAGDFAEEIYDGGGGPSMGDLAVVGIGFGAGWLLWSWGTGVLGAAGGPGVMGWGVDPSAQGRATGTTGAQRLEHEMAKAEQRLKKLKQERFDALAEYKSRRNVLDFYESRRFWGNTGRYARMTAAALFTAIGAWYLVPAEGFAGAWIAAKGTAGVTGLKAASATGGGLLGGYSFWSEPQSVTEAQKWIDKFKPRVESAYYKYWSLEGQVKDQEQHVLHLKGQKLFGEPNALQRSGR